ncbi:4Fe-4S dicluster domain-containing protein [Isoptericola sp. b441]|uniref:4Fe-4S dicluster domain-containing protein n=1 Tax=Actinotalea lenta TaxID=3064654 RepID=A0ABT9D7C0_9CELL|nr:MULTISPECIES: 4Fe-4S dicluster domain-containing protein [unclassified Isoptericola]MDO8106450.1 4Fe-4S dicluster domain-containing protein [Isoptericola sp. b441]MDO8121834.1 4Fe-4S dicluster domain-containing protein [Isoptericola sp. b490]
MTDGPRIIGRDQLARLVEVLTARGYAVVAPTVRAGAVVLDEVVGADDLPWGVGDVQDAGTYRLRERDDEAVFGQAAAVRAVKPVLFPADELIWRGHRSGTDFAVTDREGSPQRPVAFLGVRDCDLRALARHDEVLAGRAFADTRYQRRRAGTFLAAVTCAEPGGTCFCTSMGGGPHPENGYDLALTELLDPHRFVVEVGSDTGADVLAELDSEPAGAQDLAAVHDVVAHATESMGRSMDTEGLRDLLYASAESPVWDEVGNRCLTCMNCTMVCPTCFCTTVEDVSALGSADAERRRVWDSCFSEEFAHIHGGSLRTEVRSRYRQWITHKLAAWQDQFGSLGCVGCGRCITWCPVGIDITAEAAKLRAAAPLTVGGAR